MKKNVVLLLCFLAILLSGCDGSNNSAGTQGNPAGDGQVEQPGDQVALPGDEVRDTLKSKENTGFEYSTISMVAFDLTIKDCNALEIDGAYVTLTDADGTIICRGRSEAGAVGFNATISNLHSVAKLIVEHKSYEERIIEIENIDDYLAIDRTLYMATRIKDQEIDETGLTDEYTDSKHFIFAHKKFIVAYEDLYPEVGDADFNDTVALLDITVYTERTLRYVNKVVIRTTILAAGSTLDQYLYLNIYGSTINETDYKLGIDLLDGREVHQVLKKDGVMHYNSYKRGDRYYNEYYQPEAIITEIDFSPRICTLHFPPMPFDPYLIAAGRDGEVHLPMVETPYEGKRLGGSDEGMVVIQGGETITFENFPWALVFPVEEFEGQVAWRWPLETWGRSALNDPRKANIFKAYPYFKDWYLSEGEECPGWYLLPDEFEQWIYTDRPW